MKFKVADCVVSLPVLFASRVCLLLAMICPLTASAQFLRYRNYDVDDGLPSSEVYDMLQDHRGFIWFATDMGVSRYDGYSFTTFTTENGLPDNTIFTVYEDQVGRIWFTSFSGRLCYYANGRMHQPECNKVLGSRLKGQVITSLYVDRKDTIWVGTSKNVFFRIAPGWNQKNVDSTVVDRSLGFIAVIDAAGFIYGGGYTAENNLAVYAKNGKPIYTIGLFHRENGDPGARYSVKRMSGGNFIVTANEYIVTFNEHGIISRDKMNASGICTHVESDGTILTGTYNGLYKWSDSEFSDPKEILKFKNRIVTAIIRDRENGIWYCTEGNGVYYLANTSFLYYTEEDGLSPSKITAATAVGQTICLGHIDGTVSFLDNTSIRSLSTNEWNPVAGRPNRIASLLPHGEHQLLASTGSNILLIDALKHTSRMINARGAKKLIRSLDGSVWAYQFRGIVKLTGSEFAPSTSKTYHQYADNIYEDRSGLVWVCAIDGIWTYDSLAGFVSLGKKDSILSVRIVDVAQSDDHIMWFVSRGNGVIIKNGDSTYQVKQANGLAGNMCRTLFVDTGHTVWIGTNNGLSKIYYATSPSFHYSVESYTTDAGLFTNDINDIFKIDDKLALIHSNSVSVFDPRELESNSFVPPLYITSATQENDSAFSEGAQFDHTENYFTFNYVGLSFRDPGKVRYRYKLEGADESWRSTTSTSAAYQALLPGSYRFVVQASTGGTMWSEDATISFVILPAWWQSWMFRLAVLIVFGLLIYLLFRWRIARLQNRHEQKTQLQNRLASFELNALRAQMNPHFVFNAINSVQYFIIANDPDSSQKYLSKFAKLIRYVVDNAKLSYIPIKSEVEALNLYLELEALRFGNRLKYRFEISDSVDTEYMQIPSMLIQPYVENAIWHGIMHKEGEGSIVIRLTIDHGIICCVIEDDGVGRVKSKELKKSKSLSAHKSVGMTNTSERIEIINQISKTNLSVKVTDLYSEAEAACGTRVELRIPMNN